MKRLFTPLEKKVLSGLKIGDEILLNGVIYVARDAAHQRIISQIRNTKNGKRKTKMPFDLKGAVIYYCGPTPAKPGQIIGSAGPTTSLRMDIYTPALFKYGLKGTIGKGKRSKEVVEAMKKNKAVYFVAVGGAGAFLSKRIKKAEVIAYPELGPEAIYRLEIENFPVMVANDICGNDLFLEGRKKYALGN